MAATAVSALIVAVSLALVLAIATLLLSRDLGGLGADHPMAWHGFFMSCGVLLCMPTGITAYRGYYGKLDHLVPDRASRRLLHGVAMAFGAAFVLAGFLVAYAWHQSPQCKGDSGQHCSHLASGSSSARRAHAWIGILCVGGIFVQACAGLYKYVVRTRDNAKTLSVHAHTGPVLWLLGVVAVAVAFAFLYTEGLHWSLAQFLVVLLLLVAMVLLVAFELLRQPRVAEQEYEEVGLGMGMDEEGALGLVAEDAEAYRGARRAKSLNADGYERDPRDREGSLAEDSRAVEWLSRR